MLYYNWNFYANSYFCDRLNLPEIQLRDRYIFQNANNKPIEEPNISTTNTIHFQNRYTKYILYTIYMLLQVL